MSDIIRLLHKALDLSLTHDYEGLGELVGLYLLEHDCVERQAIIDDIRDLIKDIEHG